jgi:hypothetical protein
MSDRVVNKKKQYEPNTVTVKREFNPRKPPFNFNRKISEEVIPVLSNINEFPKLK